MPWGESPQQIRVLAKIEEWSRSTRSGDLSELTGLDDRSPVIPWVTSTRENCLGSHCPNAKDCHVNQARRQTMAADLVVVNHHLFCRHGRARVGVAELLPSVRVVVFDEAHQLSDAGLQFWGFNCRPGSSLNLPAMLSQPVWRMPVAMPIGHNWLLAWKARSCGGAMQRAMVLHLQESAAGRKVRPTVFLPSTGKLPWLRCSKHAACWCRRWTRTMTSPPDITRLAERGTSLLARLERFGQPCPQGGVRWLDVGGGLRLVESHWILPMPCAPFLPQPQESVDDDGWPATSEGLGRAWIFTSATLGHDAELSWFVKRCGLEGARILRVPSPFDYAAQAAMYVPEDFPSPSDPRHGSAVAALVANAAMSLGGRTLVPDDHVARHCRIAQVLRQQLAQRVHPWRCWRKGVAQTASDGAVPRRGRATGRLHSRGFRQFWEGLMCRGRAAIGGD